MKKVQHRYSRQYRKIRDRIAFDRGEGCSTFEWTSLVLKQYALKVYIQMNFVSRYGANAKVYFVNLAYNASPLIVALKSLPVFVNSSRGFSQLQLNCIIHFCRKHREIINMHWNNQEPYADSFKLISTLSGHSIPSNETDHEIIDEICELEEEIPPEKDNDLAESNLIPHYTGPFGDKRIYRRKCRKLGLPIYKSHKEYEKATRKYSYESKLA